MSEKRKHHKMHYYDGNVYVFGGSDGSDGEDKTIEIFNCKERDAWVRLDNAPVQVNNDWCSAILYEEF